MCIARRITVHGAFALTPSGLAISLFLWRRTLSSRISENIRYRFITELFGQSDDDALRATQEAEPVDVLVLRDLADEFGTVAAQAGNDVVDFVNSEHDAAYAQRVRRRAFRLGSDRRRRVGRRQLNPAVAVRGPHHGDVGTDVVEPDDAVHPTPLDRRLAFQLHAEFGEERFGSLEVVDNDENVVHPLDRHVPEHRVMLVPVKNDPRLTRRASAR